MWVTEMPKKKNIDQMHVEQVLQKTLDDIMQRTVRRFEQEIENIAKNKIFALNLDFDRTARELIDRVYKKNLQNAAQGLAQQLEENFAAPNIIGMLITHIFGFSNEDSSNKTKEIRRSMPGQKQTAQDLANFIFNNSYT